MNDDIIEVNQDPLGSFFPFDPKWLASCGLGFHHQVFGHRLDVPAGTARGNDEQVRQWILSSNIDLLNIDGFEVFEGGDHQIPELIGRQCVVSGFIGQMKSPEFQCTDFILSWPYPQSKARFAQCIQ